MKNLFAGFVLGLCLFAQSAFAQGFARFTPTTLLNGGTNKVTAVTTNGFLTIDVPKTDNLALYYQAAHVNASGAGDVDAVTLRIFRGFDGGRFETNTWQTIVFPTGASTATISVVTNIAVAHVPYLRCRFENNSTNAHVTNLVFAYGFKN